MSFNIDEVLPKDWDIKVLEDITKRVKVGFVGSCNKDYCEEKLGIPMIRTTNLSKQGVILENLKYVTPEFHNKNKKSQLNKGDILIARHGSNGLASLWKQDIEAQCLNVVVVETDDSKCNKEYLTYAINSPIINNQILAMVGGSVQGVVNTKSIAQVLVPYPSLEEQKAIANILSSLDEKIELNNQMNKTLEEMAQALFKRWFIDFEFPNEDGEPYKSSGGEMGDSKLGMIPKEWKVKTIADICYCNKYSYTNKDSWEYINYLDTANITGNKIGEIQRIDCAQDKIPSRAKRKVKKDSIVYSTVRPNQLHYGVIKNPDENMLVSTGFVVLDSKEKFLKNDLIYYWLTQLDTTEKLQAIAETTTSTYPSIKASDIKNMKIVLPTKELLMELSNKFWDINNYINALQEECSILKDIRDILLPKLMSGEIRVANIQG